MMKSLLFVATLALSLGLALTNTIGKQAESKAYATRLRAQQDSANQEQTRRHRETRFAFEQAKREAVAPYQIAAKQNFIWTLGTASIVMVVVVVAAGSYWIAGESRAKVAAANLRAGLIPLDKVTRQYPLFVHETRGRFYLVNPNNGSVMKANQVQPPMLELASDAASVQRLGVQQTQEDKYSIIMPKRKGVKNETKIR